MAAPTWQAEVTPLHSLVGLTAAMGAISTRFCTTA
jgi:hypothetical protein